MLLAVILCEFSCNDLFPMDILSFSHECSPFSQDLFSEFFNCFYATGPKVSFSKYMQSEMSHKGSLVSRADECWV